MAQAVAYYRVSTRAQGRSALGLDAQREAVARFAEEQGIVLLAEFLETESGKGADALARRPWLRAAMEAARSARCPVLVARLDRLSRDVAFISGLMAQRTPFLVAELEPGTALAQDVRMVLLDCVSGLFFRVSPWRWKMRDRAEVEAAMRPGAHSSSRLWSASSSNAAMTSACRASIRRDRVSPPPDLVRGRLCGSGAKPPVSRL